MAVFTKNKTIKTKGRMDKVLLDDYIVEVVKKSKIGEGFVMVFAEGCLGVLVITENEPGILNHDIDYLFDKALGLPYGESFADGMPYRHHETWHDDNGAGHLRALMLHHSISIPVIDRKIILGTWQNIFLMECDTRPRTRNVWFQVQGE